MYTRREFGQTIGIGTTGMSFLPLIGCGGQSDITRTLQLVIVGAEAVLPFIPGISAGQVGLVTGWLTAISDATVFATQELASADSPLVKADKIAAEFAKIIQPSLPGASAALLAKIVAVTHAVTVFLATVRSAPTAARNAGQPAVLTAGDIRALPKIAARAQALKAKIGK